MKIEEPYRLIGRRAMKIATS